MLSNIGIPGLILIILFALIVFGPKKLPEMGKSIGRSLREFKSATKDTAGDDEEQPAASVNKASQAEAAVTHAETTAAQVAHQQNPNDAVADKV